MPKVQKKSIADEVIERVEELAEDPNNEDGLESLLAILNGEANQINVCDVLMMGLPEGEDGGEPDEPEEAPRGRRGGKQVEDDEPEEAPRGRRGRAAAAAEDDEPEEAPRGRRGGRAAPAEEEETPRRRRR